jgi:RNA polymerase sigma-70 factor (ECF subfamily)
MELDGNFFRTEAGRLVAALTRVFGVRELALAEDVAQEAFCRALDVWKVHGIPNNPSAWLMTTAKNVAIDVIRRRRTAQTFAPELGRLLESEWTLRPAIDEAFSVETIRDEQLRMMFTCCHPQLSSHVQVALVLNVLCGFSAAEIAEAFLITRAAAEKRIARGKRALRSAPQLFDLDDDALGARLSAVRQVVYLLFNEGYHGASTPVRAELCGEAIRLAGLLRAHPCTAGPATSALASLMCLNAARLPLRVDAAGELNQLASQDRALWDHRLVAEGLALLEESAAGDTLTAHHVEAAIAAVHARATSVESTEWSEVVSLYDRLMEIAPSPVVALNRAIAIGQRDGPERGLEALLAIPGSDRLAHYPFHPAALGELELRRDDPKAARTHFEAARALARNDTERRFFDDRVRVARARIERLRDPLTEESR